MSFKSNTFHLISVGRLNQGNMSDGHVTHTGEIINVYNKLWNVGVLGFDSRRGLGIFLFTTASGTTLAPTQLPIQWVRGARGSFPGGKAAGR